MVLIYLNPLRAGTEVYLSQYHGYWCPGSFRRQETSTHDNDYVE